MKVNTVGADIDYDLDMATVISQRRPLHTGVAYNVQEAD